MICGFKKTKKCTPACQYYMTCTRKITEESAAGQGGSYSIESDKNNIQTVQGNQNEDKANRIAAFEQWALNNGYKEVTIKGFVSALNSMDRLETTRLMFGSVWEISDLENLADAINAIKRDSDYVNSSRTHYGYSLNVYKKYVQDVECDGQAGFETNTVEGVTFSDAEAACVRRVLMKYPNLGLYVRQICDQVGMEKEKVRSILDKASWCIKEINRYYYDEQSEEFLEDVLFGSDTHIEPNETTGSASMEEECIDEKVELMNNDFDAFLKKIRDNRY